ncbi:MAG: hypothetical protein NTW76_05075 [Corynebacteriales bacterium]|nr:hypothetical protein [Mycobacteriales bacterium]
MTRAGAAEAPSDETTDDEAAATVDGSADTLDEPTPERGSAHRLRRAVVPLAAALLVAGAGATTWWTHAETVADTERVALDGRYLSAARQMVLNLITVDPADASAVTDRILDGGTGEFRSEFASRADSFVSVVRQAAVSTKGSVTEAGIERSDSRTASVLIAATSTVTNGAGADNEPRVWRLRLALAHDGDRILTSKVDFAV